MTPDDFRRLALSLPGTVENSHMDHSDFRARGKIFATLGYPNDEWGMVKLSRRDQAAWVESDASTFVPAKGAWGWHGCTCVHLKSVTIATLRLAIKLAWDNVTGRCIVIRRKKSRA